LKFGIGIRGKKTRMMGRPDQKKRSLTISSAGLLGLGLGLEAKFSGLGLGLVFLALALFKAKVKVFARIFCVPASSAPVERIFSHSGLLMRPNRAKMSDPVLEHLVFLKCNQC